MTDQLDDDDFFSDDLTVEGDNATTAKVIATFNEWTQKQQKIDDLGAELKTLNSEVSKIKSDTMPSLLAELGTDLWRDPETGLTVELETSVNSTLPKDMDKRNAIFDALRPIGINEILAEEYNVTFKPNDKRAMALREILGLSPQEDVIDDDSDAPAAEGRLTNEQMDLVQRLRETFEFNDLPATEKLGAHPSTLKSWLKKRIIAGKGDMIRDAGIWHGKAAKVTKPKASK